MTEGSQMEGAIGLAMATRRRELLKLIDPAQVTQETLLRVVSLLGDLIEESIKAAELRWAMAERLKELEGTLRGNADRVSALRDQAASLS